MDNCGTRIFVLLAIAVMVAGIVAYALLRQPSDYDYERREMSLDTARTLQPWLVAFRVALGVVLLIGLTGVIRAGLGLLEKRRRLIYPNEKGQFPAIPVEPGQAIVDINRLPDGKAVMAVVGGRLGLLLTLFFRYILRQPVPELTQQPVVVVAPHDTSPEQMAVTDAAQRAQIAAAVFSGEGARPPAQAIPALLAGPVAEPMPDRLPPWLEEGHGPREVQLLLQAARQQWIEGVPGETTVDATPAAGTARLAAGANHV